MRYRRGPVSPLRPVVLGLGSNLGGRVSLLRAAADLLAHRLEAEVSRAPVWRTAPVGPPQPDYLNTAVGLRTGRALGEVLDVALGVERTLGRVRATRWGPRTLDADVLWHDGPAVHDARIDVPHPELTRRPFALAPLLALAPDARGEDGARLADLDAAREAPGPRVLEGLGEGFAAEEVSHTADEGFRVRALDRADLLAAAAEALGAIVVDPRSVAPAAAVTLRVSCDADDDARMVAWLSEVLFAVDSGRFAVRRVAVLDDGDAHVEAVLLGEPLDEVRHAVRTAVKAVTWHGLEVGREGDGWRAQVIVDL